MPVYILGDKPVFPNPELAEPGGLLAVGGDLSPERLLAAYRTGIFPWYSEGEPILWWSPDPRLVLFPGEVKVSRSLRQRMKRGDYEITFDHAFEDVITACSEVHTEREGGTWITDEMLDAYITLHELGHAHSVESWHEGELAGGLYGVSIGRAFFGESMFALMPDASKVALVALDRRLSERGFAIIDCQVETAHLKSMGAREISRSEFLKIIKDAVDMPRGSGGWE